MGLTAREAAEILGIRLSSVHRLVLKGVLPKQTRHAKAGLHLADVEAVSLARVRYGQPHRYWANTREAADLLGVTIKRVHQLIRKDFLPAVQAPNGRWAMQVHRPSSRAHVETMLRRHAYPTFGSRPLASILPSEIQAWVTRLGTSGRDRKALSPATIGVLHSIVSGVMKAAVRDRRLLANPCDGTRLPKVESKRVVPPTTEQVAALTAAMSEDLQALITFAAGTGMHQGECSVSRSTGSTCSSVRWSSTGNL